MWAHGLTGATVTDGVTIASLNPGEEGTIRVTGITDEDTRADPMGTRVGLRGEEAMAADIVRPTAVDTVVVMTVGTDVVTVAIGNRL